MPLRKQFVRLFQQNMAALAAVLFTMTASTWAAAAPSATIAATNDLYRVDVDFPEVGTLSIYLPSDMRSGDRITGRVQFASEKAGEASRPVLRIALGTSVQPAEDGLHIWDVGTESGYTVALDLLDSSGKNLISIPVPLGARAQGTKGTTPGHSGTGVRRIPAQLSAADQQGIEKSLELEAEVLAVSPRAVVILDKLVLTTGPLPVTCCAEGGPCGEASCCVDIPSNGCTFCNFNDYPICLKGPPTPD